MLLKFLRLFILIQDAVIMSLVINQHYFLQLHLDPASSNTLPASGNGSITHNLRVTNSQHGKVYDLHILLFICIDHGLDFLFADLVV
jgi:hypothetical protein